MSRYTLAQIVPDQSLGAESSTVINNGEVVEGQPVDLIRNGAQRGGNLFHSFQEFSVRNGQRVYFAQPAGVNHILSRVTGNTESRILGTLGVLGNADLFLLNPNGIVFGAEAQLDVRGSFIASTGDRLLFDNGFAFSASNPASLPLLSINVPVGIQYGRNPGRIVNRSQTGSNLFEFPAGLQVQDEQTLALLGGEILLSGGSLTAQSGHIELGSVATDGQVQLVATNPGWAFDYGDTTNFQKIDISGFSVVVAEAGGGIHLRGRQLRLTDSFVAAFNSGASHGETIRARLTETIDLSRSQLLTLTAGSGRAGNINLVTQRLRVEEGSQIISSDQDSTLSTGLSTGSGQIRINAADAVEVFGILGSDPAAIATLGFVGDAGDIVVNTRRFLLRQGGRLTTFTFGAGAAGRLEITALDAIELIGGEPAQSGLFASSGPDSTGRAGNLVLRTNNLTIANGAEISTATLGAGRSGNLIVNATASIRIFGISPNGQLNSRLTATTDGSGDAGNMRINTNQLLLQEGGQVLSATFSSSRGDAGRIQVNATEHLEISGTAGNFNSQLSAASLQNERTGEIATGAAEEIKIATDRLTVNDGGGITVTTLGGGSAGNLEIQASIVEIVGEGSVGAQRQPSVLRARTLGAGNAGSIRIEADRVTVRNGAEIAVSSLGEGRAGNLIINANQIDLAEGNMTAETRTADLRAGANIRLLTDRLLMQNQSQISARAFARANGGNLTINAGNGFVVAAPRSDSDIIASAERGNGGTINIYSRVLLDFAERRALAGNGTNDIDASSEFGQAGTVTISSPEIEIRATLPELPIAPINTTLAQGCQLAGEQATAQFFNTGRGGLPQNPYESFSSTNILDDLRLPTQATAATRSAAEPIEAQGWIVNSEGRVVLVADMNPIAPHTCHLR